MIFLTSRNKGLSILLLCLALLGLPGPAVQAAPAPDQTARAAAPAALTAQASSDTQIKNIRFSQGADKLRIVLDVSKIPQYQASLSDNGLQIAVELSGTVNKSGIPSIKFGDPVVDGLTVVDSEPGKTRLLIDLNLLSNYKVFTLDSPGRLVIDILRTAHYSAKQQIVPGLIYTELSRDMSFGPVTAYMLDIDPSQGLALRPVLSNNEIAGLATVSTMAAQAKALAAVNGSYFALSGEILGLLKMEGDIVSTPELPRSAWGVLPDGKMMIGMVSYTGQVVLPNGQTVDIQGVNRERGPNELILYNHRYGDKTRTNGYGLDYVITNGRVRLINDAGDTVIPGESVILSAHGDAAAALSSLKEGDEVKVIQTLGGDWDKAVSAIGAGPTLVKDGNVFLTTKVEEFGSDVAGGRAPRTALGITADKHVLLVVVDGRQPHSAGLSLSELAAFMKDLGAVDAVNFDGGGSSDMVVNGTVVNKPSDGRERRVGDALAVVTTAAN